MSSIHSKAIFSYSMGSESDLYGLRWDEPIYGFSCNSMTSRKIIFASVPGPTARAWPLLVLVCQELEQRPTQMALFKLLNGSCYHFVDLLKGDQKDLDFWNRALSGETIKDQEWIDFYEGRGFRAGLDNPFIFFYKDLMRIFPNAKVLLTNRDPEKWYESVKGSAYQLYLEQNSFPTNLYLKIEGYGMMESVGKGKEEAVKFYNKWVETVKATVPKDRLLIFKAKDGWEPLCKFLDVPEPDEPFPFLNDSKDFRTTIKSMKMFSKLIIYGIPIVLSLISFWVYSDV